MRRVRVLTALALIVSAFAWVRPAGAASDPIQPGDYMESGGAACTLNFVYDGTGSRKGKVYFGTAAHCVEKVGDDVLTINDETFGDVAWIGDDWNTARDFALIQVRTGYLSRVLPAVKGYPS